MVEMMRETVEQEMTPISEITVKVMVMVEMMLQTCGTGDDTNIGDNFNNFLGGGDGGNEVKAVETGDDTNIGDNGEVMVMVEMIL